MNRADAQAIEWLKSMAASDDIFASINAENCLALIEKLNERYGRLGAQFCTLKKKHNKIYDDRLWTSAALCELSEIGKDEREDAELGRGKYPDSWQNRGY